MSEPKGTLQLYDSSVALTLTLLEEVAAKLKGASELDWQSLVRGLFAVHQQ